MGECSRLSLPVLDLSSCGVDFVLLTSLYGYGLCLTIPRVGGHLCPRAGIHCVDSFPWAELYQCMFMVGYYSAVATLPSLSRDNDLVFDHGIHYTTRSRLRHVMGN